MKQHKWHKEIKAWADGAEIEWRYAGTEFWIDNCNNHPVWNNDEYEFRIKPQPKEPQYLYVYRNNELLSFELDTRILTNPYLNMIGKIKLEQDDE